VLRSIAAASFLAGSAVMALNSPASAAPGEVVSDVRAGDDGVVVGTARFSRVSVEGGQRLRILVEVPGGIDETHVCLSTEPFTQRAAAGSCPYTQGATGTTASYDIALPAQYVGRTVHVQLHVVTGDETAFAGWRQGNPFYGTVAVDDPTPSTEVPVGAAGIAVLAGVLAAGAGLAHRRSRRSRTDALEH
jgi:hypothetical protein